MTATLQGATAALLGLVALRLTLTGEYQQFLKPGMWPLLIPAALVLVVLGGHHALRAPDVGAGPRVGLLLLAPVLTLIVVAPGSLGAYAAERSSAAPAPPPGLFEPLPGPVDGAVDLRVREFVSRALYDGERSLDGVPVRLLGFVAPGPEPDTFLLTRFLLNCCAADGQAMQVVVRGGGAVPPPDTWVQVEGTWAGRVASGAPDPTRPAELDAAAVTVVEPPDQPYES